MTHARNLEGQQDCPQPASQGEAWASIAAMQCSPGQRGPVAEQIASQSMRMQDQGLLGNLTLSTLDQNFSRIDQSGNGNGVIERQDLRNFIERQQTVSPAARDNLAVMGAQNALHYMNMTRQETLTRHDVTASLKDGLLPAQRAMQNANKQYDGLVNVMRGINPDSVANGNQINVGLLREALEQQPHRFTRAQQEAVRTLVGDAYNVANSIGPLNRVANWLWNGNDGRYISPESIAERAHALGSPTRIRPIRHY